MSNLIFNGQQFHIPQDQLKFIKKQYRSKTISVKDQYYWAGIVYSIDETHIVDLLFLLSHYYNKKTIIWYIQQYYTDVINIEEYDLTLRLCHRDYFEWFFNFAGKLLTREAWRRLYWIAIDYVDNLDYTGFDEPLFGDDIELWEPRRMLSMRPEIQYGRYERIK